MYRLLGQLVLCIVGLVCRCEKTSEVKNGRAVRREGPRRLRRRTDAPTESTAEPGRAATPASDFPNRNPEMRSKLDEISSTPAPCVSLFYIQLHVHPLLPIHHRRSILIILFTVTYELETS